MCQRCCLHVNVRTGKHWRTFDDLSLSLSLSLSRKYIQTCMHAAYSYISVWPYTQRKKPGKRLPRSRCIQQQPVHPLPPLQQLLRLLSLLLLAMSCVVEHRETARTRVRAQVSE